MKSPYTPYSIYFKGDLASGLGLEGLESGLLVFDSV